MASETIQDLQPYLDGTPTATKSAPPAATLNPTDKGRYYVDQVTGQYYFQPNDGAAMTYVSTAPQATATSGVSQPTADNNQVVVNSGGDQYQTVTIVPSDANTGEVSYVLIVQPPEDKDKDNGSGMNVYDFDADGDVDFGDSDGMDDEKGRAKGGMKRSQMVSQAHMCNYCNYTTSKRYLLSRHMKSHSEERPHKCSVCERGFKTLASLQNHVNTHTGTKPHHCKFCDASFTTSGELVRHVRYRHTHEKPHRCEECDYTSVELSKLKRHMRCHTGERPFQCSHCTYASPDTFKLKRHLRIHTGEKPYECNICHAKFTQSNSLKAHRMIHTGDKPIFACDLCPTTCGRKTDLRLHIQKLHTAERPMHCKMCGKSFPDRYSLKTHKKSHEGEKCFKCDLCPYSSVSQRHLESHMLIHTDQKPFQCPHCDQCFRQRQLLRRHENLYHNPDYIQPMPKEKTHECPECSRSFRHKGNLIRHLALHDPESTIQEKSLALKLGRQRRIQIIDGKQVEVMTGDDDEDFEYYEGETDEEDGDAMMVEQGPNGPQYVVLEVIQIKPGDKEAGTSSHLADIQESENDFEDESDRDEGDATMSTTTTATVVKKERIVTAASASKVVKSTEEMDPGACKKETDIANCFGFDDEEEDG